MRAADGSVREAVADPNRAGLRGTQASCLAADGVDRTPKLADGVAGEVLAHGSISPERTFAPPETIVS